jgi:hypothetical protein
MSTPRRRYWAIALGLCTCWLGAAGCGAGDAEPSGGAAGTGGSSNGGMGGKNGGPTVVDPGGTSAVGGSGGLNPLCGPANVPSACLPDSPRSCRNFVPPVEAAAGAGGAPARAEGGEGSGGDARGPGGQPAIILNGLGGAGAGGESGGGGNFGGESVGGGGGQGGESQEPQTLAAYGCQVSRENNQPYRACVAAGSGSANAPCFTAADCAPGLACVTEGEAARCLPYCCDVATACGAGSYCAERPLRRSPADQGDAATPRVPVCVPADGCSLEDRYPCPSGEACRCPGDTACMVVRDDGTTTCQEPGTGKQGEACPCAWNHVCSKVTNQCVQLCRTDAETDECGSQKCQASSELPDSFGFCVGPPG